MTEVNKDQEASEVSLAPVTTTADVAKELAKNIAKLGKADSKAAEFDTAVKTLNEEIIAIASGSQAQTMERSMTHVVRELSKNENRATAIREKTVEDAVAVREGFLALGGEVARMLAGFNLTLDEADTPADAPADETEADEVE